MSPVANIRTLPAAYVQRQLNKKLDERQIHGNAFEQKHKLSEHYGGKTMDQHMKIGDILVQAGIITAITLERALARQKGTSLRLGIILEEMGVITEKELAEALAKQTGYKSTSGFAKLHFDQELLSLVPEEMAICRMIFPLKRNETTLALAIDDPNDRETLDLLARQTGLRIMPVLAPRHEIREAVKQHYMSGVVTDAGDKKKILVVEDSPSMVAVLKNTLEDEGYVVVTAKDGIEGLKMAMQELPDLIITDDLMPKMDGFTMMKNLRSSPETASIPAMLITSQSAGEEEKKAFDSGFIDFILKPAQPIRVISRVKRAFQLIETLKSVQGLNL
jgi:CheY-like chemotaxis protein